VLKALPAGSVDVIVTSPPYNQAIAYHQHNDRMPREAYLEFITACFTSLRCVLKPSGSFFLNINGSGTKDDPTLPSNIAARAFGAGFVPQNTIVWVKAIEMGGVIRGHIKPVNSTRYLSRAHEMILHLTKQGNVSLDKPAIGLPYADKSNLARHNKSQADATIAKPDNRDCGNVWPMPYSTVQSKGEKFNHPAGFPVELPIRCIKLHGLHPDLLVLDPFLGAGTTLVAAQSLGCRSIGIEIDHKYVEIAIQRLKEVKGQSA
jgi:site-specific DNA-methyltransferase (adenine-specific)